MPWRVQSWLAPTSALPPPHRVPSGREPPAPSSGRPTSPARSGQQSWLPPSRRAPGAGEWGWGVGVGGLLSPGLICSLGGPCWSAVSSSLPREALPHGKVRSGLQTQLPQAGPSPFPEHFGLRPRPPTPSGDPSPLAAAFQPQPPRKCLLSFLCSSGPKDPDLGWETDPPGDGQAGWAPLGFCRSLRPWAQCALQPTRGGGGAGRHLSWGTSARVGPRDACQVSVLTKATQPRAAPSCSLQPPALMASPCLHFD